MLFLDALEHLPPSWSRCWWNSPCWGVCVYTDRFVWENQRITPWERIKNGFADTKTSWTSAAAAILSQAEFHGNQFANCRVAWKQGNFGEMWPVFHCPSAAGPEPQASHTALRSQPLLGARQASLLLLLGPSLPVPPVLRWITTFIPSQGVLQHVGWCPPRRLGTCPWPADAASLRHLPFIFFPHQVRCRPSGNTGVPKLWHLEWEFLS